MSVLIERREGKLYLTYEANGKSTGPARFDGNDEQLHTSLVNGGWTKIGSAKGDKLAGVYVQLGKEF